MGIGCRIREARINNGMLQEELATIIGVKPSAISNYENDTSHPKEEILYKLIDALGVEPNFLFQDNIKSLSKGKHENKHLPTNVTLAAHRTDGYDTDLPDEAQEELDHLLDYIRAKYRKKGTDDPT